MQHTRNREEPLHAGERYGEDVPYDSECILLDGTWICPNPGSVRAFQPYEEMPYGKLRSAQISTRADQMRNDIRWYLESSQRSLFLRLLRQIADEIRRGIPRLVLCDPLMGPFSGEAYRFAGKQVLRDTGTCYGPEDSWRTLLDGFVEPGWITIWLGAVRWESVILSWARRAYTEAVDTVVEAYWRRWGKHLYWGVGRHQQYTGGQDGAPVFDTRAIAWELGVTDLEETYRELPPFRFNLSLGEILALDDQHQGESRMLPRFVFLDGVNAQQTEAE